MRCCLNKNIPDAVKFVPYSSIVATNNFNEWIDTEFELVSGNLPAGVEFISSTGEIYGVPTETGTFNFTIAAKYLVDGQEGMFERSTQEYSLTVKENTNDNE